MIISVQNQKGGVGKTTLAVHISYVLSTSKKRKSHSAQSSSADVSSRVLLIDADPQGSSRDWAAARESEPPFSVVGLDRPTIHRDLPKLSEGYDHVVIDGPPRVTDLARSAIIAADLVVIPIQPSPYDVWAAHDVVDLIKEAMVFKENLKSVFVINRKIVNTAIGRDVVEALSEYSIPVTSSSICQRVAFAESAASGQTVMELNGKSSASKEIKALVKELLSYG